MLRAAQLRAGSPADTNAKKRTPFGVPGARLPYGNRPRLQARFTDLALHNPGAKPYRYRITGPGGKSVTVEMPGREPKWPDAHADHVVLRAEQGARGCNSAVAIYSVRRILG